MNRRRALTLIGGTLVVAAGGAGIFATTRTPGTALAPWAQAGAERYRDPRMHALSYAVLAPNPHNRQPWLVELNEDNGIILRFDVSRQLPHTDPFDRQLTIGLGCFLELLKMAANAHGFAITTDLFPDGADDAGLNASPVAVINFQPDTTAPADALWPFVKDRRTHKLPFDTAREIGEAELQAIVSVAANRTEVDGTIDRTAVRQWRAVTGAALEIELQTPRTYKESVDLFRIGKKEVEANPDGIALSGALFEVMAATGALSRESALDTSSSAYRQGRAAVLENCRTAMGHLWMVTAGNSRLDQIDAGADWLRVNLACTSLGLGFQPLSQALQEYPEMDSLYRRTHELLAPQGGTVQMLARIGYGDTIPPSPRWQIESRVIHR